MKKAMPKKCPFCGMIPISATAVNPDSYWDGSIRGESYGYVICGWCNVILKADDQESAIKAWNKRGNWRRKKLDAKYEKMKAIHAEKSVAKKPKTQPVTADTLQSCLDKFDAIADMIREKRGGE